MTALRIFPLLGPLLTVGCGSAPPPPDALRHNDLGARALSLGDLDGAEAELRLALEYEPAFAPPRANLGLVLLARGQLELAEEQLRGALEADEDLAQAWGNLGVVLERLRRPGEAEGCFGRALAIDPGLIPPRRNLAFLLARRGDFAQARAQLMRLRVLAPGDRASAAVLAYCDLRLGRPHAAHDRVRGLLAQDPRLAPALLVRGLLRAQRGHFFAATRDLRDAAEDPQWALLARVRLSAVLLAAGQHAAARAEITDILRQNPTEPAAQLVAASVALAEQRLVAARAHAQAALMLRPDLAPARQLLEEVCRASPKPSQCREP